jgi:hypothetical protein
MGEYCLTTTRRKRILYKTEEVVRIDLMRKVGDNASALCSDEDREVFTSYLSL